MKARQTTSAKSAPGKNKTARTAKNKTAKTVKTEASPGHAASNGDTRAAGPARIHPAERRKLIEQAAYLRAARRNFAPGGELQDWLEAEAEVERRLQSS
jgi:hypothetical protein